MLVRVDVDVLTRNNVTASGRPAVSGSWSDRNRYVAVFDGR